MSSISSFSTHRLNIDTFINCMNTSLDSSFSNLSLDTYLISMFWITSSFMNPGSLLANSISFHSDSVYKLSPNKASYFLDAPDKLYLRLIFSMMTSLSLFLQMFNDSLKVTSRILELTSVNNTTPITMQIDLKMRSLLLFVATSPYPTVVTVWITNYHAFYYNSFRSSYSLFQNLTNNMS